LERRHASLAGARQIDTNFHCCGASLSHLVTFLGIGSAQSQDVNPAPAARNEAGDLLFKCQHCASPLIVNAAAAGMTLNCQRCGKPTLVPTMSTAMTGASPHEMTDLQRKLKENESQRTEVTGYINQLSIQLHRWKLRLQTLNERKTELEGELRKTP
jgi:transcription elongation factor Elf1